MNAYLETDRVALHRFDADDADLLIELDGDPAVMRYVTGGEPTAPDVVHERDLPSILAGYERWSGAFGLFAARERLIWTETMFVNHASRHVLDKLGLTLAGTIPTPPTCR